MHKYFLWFILLFSTQVLATVEKNHLDQLNDSLAVLMSDAYAKENKAKRFTREICDNKQAYQLSIITLEGLYGGNSFHQYLALYKPTRKMIDPVTFTGDTKYRLLGFLPVATDGRSAVDIDSIKLADKILTLTVESKRGNKANKTLQIEIQSNTLGFAGKS